MIYWKGVKLGVVQVIVTGGRKGLFAYIYEILVLQILHNDRKHHCSSSLSPQPIPSPFLALLVGLRWKEMSLIYPATLNH